MPERMPKDLTGKAGRETARRLDGKGGWRKMTAEELAKRPPRDLAGKAAEKK